MVNVPLGKEERARNSLDNPDNLAFEVAKLVCENGWTSTKIARELFPDEYRDKKTQARTIMRVKRALQSAVRKGTLRIKAPEDEELSRRLSERYEWASSFRVIKDDPDPNAPFDHQLVFQAAAREIALEIERLLKEKKQGNVVVANAGGLTLSQVVRYLAVEAIIPEDSQRLTFISLNAARRADAYDLSANFLAVRMAEIYGGSHIAVLPRTPDHIKDAYNEALENADLLITSAGTPRSYLFLWHEEEFQRPLVPEKSVGDITFIPIDSKGNPVDLDAESESNVEEHLRPRPKYGTLLKMASLKKVLVVCTRLPPHIRKGAADYGSIAKARTTRAIIEGALANHYILGASVARGVLNR